MSCDGCQGTVWFDHDKKVWKHAAAPEGVTLCRKPEPYNVSSPRPTRPA